MPGSSHGPKWLSHGWQVSAFLSLHSGQPFNFNAGTQRPGLNIIGNPFAGVSHTFNLGDRRGTVGESECVLRAGGDGLSGYDEPGRAT